MEVRDGLMASGDVGFFDAAGRLHVAGRDDDMIVSGGENVFPQEVEDCLVSHEHVVEVAALGVVDDDYGQRLRAFVVRSGEVSADQLRDHVKAHRPVQGAAGDRLRRRAAAQRDRKVLKRELAGWDERDDVQDSEEQG